MKLSITETPGAASGEPVGDAGVPGEAKNMPFYVIASRRYYLVWHGAIYATGAPGA
jgi:hypothetical protein